MLRWEFSHPDNCLSHSFTQDLTQMIAKLLFTLFAAVSGIGGVYMYSSSQGTSASSGCCAEQAPCCDPPSACCGSAAADCCEVSAACCETKSACCTSEKTAVKATKKSCCADDDAAK